MKIHSLLNPFCGDNHQNSRSPTPSSIPCPMTSYTLMPKRQKIPKDAPVFAEGTKIVGHLNYPPYEAGDDARLAEQHRRFQIFPMGEIRRKGARHIPYNSDKKDFLEKTGREAFEMFQYTYRVPGDDKEYIVVWDYNVGLVRMTPFFKSLKHSKTIPAKALRENPGLKEVSYSITGGALVCQGYWMPYQAAKAIAATFCYHIRWALTPVFGNDFPETCLLPDDPQYGKFLIDPTIVQQVIDDTNTFREQGADYKIATLQDWSIPYTPLPTPQTQQLNSPWAPADLPPPRRSEESGYCTDDRIEKNPGLSPQVSPRSSPWVSVNGGQSAASSPTLHSPFFDRSHETLPSIRQLLPMSVPHGFYSEPFQPTRILPRTAHPRLIHAEAHVSRSATASPKSLAYTGPAGKASSSPTYGTPIPEEARSPRTRNFPRRRCSGERVRNVADLDAADILLSLSTSDDLLPPPPKRTRRDS